MKIRTDHVTVFVVRRARDDFEFLQLRRSAGDYLGGTWQTVRGSAEAGETAVQTARRELAEETGLTPIEFYSLGVIESFFIAAADTLFHSPAFLAIVPTDATVELDAEHDEFRWVSRPDAPGLFMWSSEQPLFHAVDQILSDRPANAHLKL